MTKTLFVAQTLLVTASAFAQTPATPPTDLQRRFISPPILYNGVNGAPARPLPTSARTEPVEVIRIK